MLLSEGSGGIPDLGWESRPPRLGVAPFEDLSLEDQEIGRGELRVRRHRPSACARCRQPVPHACRRDTQSDADRDVLRDICAPTVAAPQEARRRASRIVPTSSPQSATPSPVRGRCTLLTAYSGPVDRPIHPDHSRWNCYSNAMAGRPCPFTDFYDFLPLTRN
jgi:hypothetical protein